MNIMDSAINRILYLETTGSYTRNIGVSSVNFGGLDIFARKICIKMDKMPEFYMILARKIIKIP